MILITVYGLDQFVTGNYSKDHTKGLAEIFEVNEEEIVFYSPNSFVFQRGVEQSSWEAIVKVSCDHKYEKVAKQIADYFSKTMTEFCINVFVQFEYFHGEVFEYINPKYPRFLEEKNMVNVEAPDSENIDVTNEDEVYTGDIFKDLKDKK